MIAVRSRLRLGSHKKPSQGFVVCDAPYVKDFIDKEVLCAETAQEIFDLGVEHQYDKERSRHLWEVVKRDHTYMNRCNGLIEIINGI